jgi:hypothetical protein
VTDTTPVREWPSCCGHPIAPTEFPKGRSATTIRSVPGGDNHEAVTYILQEEDAKRPVTSDESDGYRPWLTPGNLNRILAKGQSSPDLILTEALEASRISVNPSPREGFQ